MACSSMAVMAVEWQDKRKEEKRTRTQELPVAVYFGLRKKTDLRVLGLLGGGGGEAFRIIASESSLGLKL